MSTPSHRASTSYAPERGVFPLDHFRECDASKTRYLECLARRERDATACATLSKAYLECRMARELMAREDLTQLGFRSEHARSSAARARETTAKEANEAKTDDEAPRIAGLRGGK